MKRKYLVILSLILCISLGLSSVSAAIVASDNTNDSNTVNNDSNTVNNDSIVVQEDNQIVSLESDNSTPTPLETSIDVDNDVFPADEKSTVTAKVYTKFNEVPHLVENGTISLYVDGKEVQTVDLADCKGKAKFTIPAVAIGTDCKLVYNGGLYKDDELNFEFEKSSRDLFIDGDEAIPTTIKVVPSKITGYDGDMAKFSAKVMFTFNDVDSVVNVGTLSLLKDGKVIQTADLSKNSNPTFSFKLEKGHKYSLSYSGGNTGGELDLKLDSSSKDLNVNVLDKDNKNVDMENTGAPLAVLLVALLGLPLYFRRK